MRHNNIRIHQLPIVSNRTRMEREHLEHRPGSSVRHCTTEPWTNRRPPTRHTNNGR